MARLYHLLSIVVLLSVTFFPLHSLSVTIDPILTSLPSEADWIAERDQTGAGFGFSVGMAGDVNGDGYDDVIVGARYYDNGQDNEGAAFVYYGCPSGLSTSPDWTMEGNQAGANFGYAVGTAGDVNGDGYDDVIVGAWAYDNGQTDEGRAFVYYGHATGLSTTADWTAESNRSNAYFAVSVGTAGDVNGDGCDDVIIGAYRYDHGSWDEGTAFVWYGSATGLGANGTPANADWRVEGNQNYARLGCSVGTAGDVNGDGYDDVIVGANLYDNGQTQEGVAFVYHGSASGLSTTANWMGECNQNGVQFGFSVGTAGDVNGDGYDEVIVGAPYYDYGLHDVGAVFLYYGSATGLGTTANWTAESNQAEAYFGFSVDTAGDVNGDGYADIIVGAYRYDNSQQNEGAAFLWYGSASGLGENGTAANADWAAYSNQDSAEFGRAVGTAGDVNGDGYADVIVGAHLHDNGQINEGRAYVYFGSATETRPSTAGVSPNNGWSAPGTWQHFATVYRDPDGVCDIKYADLLINTATTNISECAYVRYDVQANRMYLHHATDNRWLPPTGVAPGTAQVIQNGYARLDVEHSTVVTSTDTVTITWEVWFTQKSSGRQYYLYLHVEDMAGDHDGWDNYGDWVVNAKPTTLYLSPNAGPVPIGPWNEFVTRYADQDGYAALCEMYLLITGSSPGTANAVYLKYSRCQNAMYLRNTADTAWLGPITPKTPGAFLENEYCKLHGEWSRWGKYNSRTLTLRWWLQFKQPFAGRHRVYLRAIDSFGPTLNGDTGWRYKGWVQVQ